MRATPIKSLNELIESGVIQLTRGKIISKKDIAAEGLVQEGLLQLLQGGEFAFVEAGEALGFGFEFLNGLNNLHLFRQRRQSNWVRFESFLGHTNLTCGT